MAEFKEISEKAKEIVGKFMDSLDGESQKELHKILPVSLYALMPDADNAILEPLEEYCVDLNGKLDKKEMTVLKKEFLAVVRYCYENHNARDLRHLDQLIELSRSWRLFSLSRDSKFLLPFAGEVRWTHYVVGGTFDGYEPDPKIWAYSQILCSAYSSDAEIKLGDSSKINEGETYSYIFAQLLDRGDVNGVVKELCDLVDNRLENNGRMCCLLPESFCYAPEWYDFRKKLCDEKNKFFVFVTAFPAILPEYTKDNICLVWLFKSQDLEKGLFELMSVKNNAFYEQVDAVNDSPDFNIKIADILEAIDNDDKQYMLSFSPKFFSADNNINLLPTRYLCNEQVCGEGAEEFIPFKNGNGFKEDTNLTHIFQRFGGGTRLNWVPNAYFDFQPNGRRLINCMSFEEKVVSLYSIMPNADKQILDALAEYRTDLSECLSPDSLSILRSEYKSIVRKCSEEGCNYCHNGATASICNLYYHRSFPRVFPPMFMLHDNIMDMCRTLMLNPDFFYKGVRNKKKFKFGSRVLLPYAGNAQFARNLEKCVIDAYEPDQKAWAFGQILKDAYDLDVEIRTGNAFEGTEGEQYDYVFASLFARSDLQSIASELYNIADKRLKDKGVMCCLLPADFCYAPEWYGLRKILTDREGQYSAVVISLGDVLEPLLGGNVCIFCLQKMTDKGGSVYLMNAKNDGFFNKVYEPIIEEDELIGEIDYYAFKEQSVFEVHSLQDERQSWRGNVEDLTGEDNLLPTRYLIEYKYINDEDKKVRLGDIVELVSPSDTDADSKDIDYTALSFVALSLNYLNCDLSSENSKRQGFIGKSKSKTESEGWTFSLGGEVITEKCLLAGCLNGRMKVGRIVASPLCPFELSREIIPFKLKSDVVSEEYLLRCLMSDDVAEQARMLSWGGFYNCVDPEDFPQIMISVPKKEEQERLCREDVRKSLERADKKLREFNEEFRRDIHMKTHAIGQTIFALGGWLEVLQRARRENSGTISDDTVVGKLRPVAVSEIYDNLRKTFDHLQEQIHKMDRGNGLKKEDFALTTFIEEYVKDNRRSEFEFEYNAGEHHRYKNVLADDRIIEGETETYRLNHRDWNNGDGEPIEYVYFPKEALKIVLDNIVSNACSHGFTDPDAKNIIKIEVAEDLEDDNAFLIRVSNNGKPMTLSQEEVFAYGNSLANGGGKHYGLGGYEVKHLMWEFGGDAKLLPTPPDGEFTVCYELKLPKGKEVSYKKNA